MNGERQTSDNSSMQKIDWASRDREVIHSVPLSINFEDRTAAQFLPMYDFIDCVHQIFIPFGHTFIPAIHCAVNLTLMSQRPDQKALRELPAEKVERLKHFAIVNVPWSLCLPNVVRHGCLSSLSWHCWPWQIFRSFRTLQPLVFEVVTMNTDQ